MNWLRVRELVRKEFIQLLRDKRNHLILFVAPLLQMLIFGYVVNYDIRNIRVAVVDYSHTQESRKLAEAFEGSPVFSITHTLSGERYLEDVLLRGTVDMVVKIPPDFAALLRQRQTAAIQIMADGSMSNMAATRMAYTSTVLDQFNRRMIRELYPQQKGYGRIDARIRTWYNPNLESRYFFVPGIVAFLVMMISLILTSTAIIREREAGTMEQLIVTPVKASELILGKTIPYIIVSLIQLTAVIILAINWFEIPLVGSIPLLLLAVCLFLLSTLGIGLFISTISSTQQEAFLTTYFFILPAFKLSGFIFPIANMPEIVQWLTYLNPLRYFLVIVRGIFLKGVGMSVLWPQYLCLAILGAIVFSGAIAHFKKTA